MRRRDVRESRTPIRAAAREEELSTLIGYARISTAGEAIDLQREALDRAGVDVFFVDVADAAAVKRPQLERAVSSGYAKAASSSSGGSIGSVETCAISSKRSSTWRAAASAFGASTRTSTPRPSWASSCSAPSGRPWPSSSATSCKRSSSRTDGPDRNPGPAGRGPKPKLDEQKRALAFELHYNQGLSIADVCRRLDISRANLLSGSPQRA